MVETVDRAWVWGGEGRGNSGCYWSGQSCAQVLANAAAEDE